uniref:Seminal fluid protein n=1 Tax=Pieris rapae TaxID=64459 RepID=A0A220K8L5_PIERA|nr:seminal fluid protein [Pieris rapae]
MIRFICVLFVAALVSAAAEKKPHYDINDAPALFEKFIKDYDRHYKDAADREIHYKAFVDGLKIINELNAGKSTSTFDINQFADLTPEEFDTMNGFKPHM